MENSNSRCEFITRNGRTYITQQEAADMLGVTPRTIRNMVSDGRLVAYHLGPRVIRLRLDEVEAALTPITYHAPTAPTAV